MQTMTDVLLFKTLFLKQRSKNKVENSIDSVPNILNFHMIKYIE